MVREGERSFYTRKRGGTATMAGKGVPDRRTIGIHCMKCRVLLYRYAKDQPNPPAPKKEPVPAAAGGE